MYESLTAFIPGLETGKYGKWSEQTGDGTPKNPYVFCHIEYEEPVENLIQALLDIGRNKNMRYVRHIAETSGISSITEPLKEKEIAALDGETIVSLFLYIISLTRFDDSLFLDFCECGNALCLLNRLKEIDETENNQETS